MKTIEQIQESYNQRLRIKIKKSKNKTHIGISKSNKLSTLSFPATGIKKYSMIRKMAGLL